MTKTKEKQPCSDNCDSCSSANGCQDQKKLQIEAERKMKLQLSKIKHKIAVISGKGGVGKSTVTVNLATALALQGFKIGVLDADIHGPCVPKMLGLKKQRLVGNEGGRIEPITGRNGIKVASVSFLVNDDDSPVIWRGPMKMQLIKEFLSELNWGELDFLLIDLPPGTGDEPLSVVQLIPDLDGVIIVTMPSEVSETVVKKSVNFARQVNVPIIGIIENMSGFVCPDCGKKHDIFKSGGGKRIAQDLAIPYLGSIPIDPKVCDDSDAGIPFMQKSTDSVPAKIFEGMVTEIKSFVSK